MHISITKTSSPKQKPTGPLGFGKIFTDHMFIMDYTEGIGWHNAQILPYGKLELEPSSMVFHYAQEVFEGLKAYKNEDGGIFLFRPEKNIQRMNKTNDRLCIPQLNVDDALEAIKQTVLTDQDWIPSEPGTSLYIRPFIIATDAFLGVHASKTYKFIIILSPVGSYYSAGLAPVSIGVEDEYVRAVKGGTGEAKCGGNYAASLKGQLKAEQNGYSQALWLDGIEKKYIDEVGAMNVFFVIDGEVVTPALTGSILPGVTRDSVITYLKSEGYKVTERLVSIDEIIDAADKNILNEMFGTGTAAVISPVGTLCVGGREIVINGGEIGKISQELYDSITGIQFGRIHDKFGWTLKIN